MIPRLSTRDVVCIEVGDDLVVQDPAGATLGRLSRVGAVVWESIDGERTIPAIVGRVSARLDRVVAAEEVFAALDVLADCGLLERRVAPPVGLVAQARWSGGLTRRVLLGRAAAGLAPVAIGLMPATGLAQSNAALEQLAKVSEAQSKQAETEAAEAASKQIALQERQSKLGSTENLIKEAGAKGSESSSKSGEAGTKESGTKESGSKESGNKEAGTKEAGAKEGGSKANAEASEKQVAELGEKANVEARAKSNGGGTTQIAEPATAALLAAGIAGVMGLRALQERRGKVAQEDRGEDEGAD